MHTQSPEPSELEKLRQQFDHAPYPRTPLEFSPRENYSELFKNNLTTAHYLKYRRVIDPANKLILDAGCGSGLTSLLLAEANPGATIIGIDLSDTSIQLARQRLNYHGFNQAKFYTCSIDDLPQMGLAFDYINCDEVLYLLPDPLAGLHAMKAVLKPQGIIRANLHNVHQRFNYYRAQELFKFIGLMNESPADFEREAVVETMKALKQNTLLKMQTWSAECDRQSEEGIETIFANHLLVGDKGYTVPELFALLQAAHLDFISMVDWRHWDVTDLFNDPDNLPALWGMSLMEASAEEKLHLFELLHPAHRLMDFWCTHADQADGRSIDQWNDSDWRNATVHLHPQLRQEKTRQDILSGIANGQAVEISRYLQLPTLGPIRLDSFATSCLLPLWDNAQPFMALVDRYLKTRPVDLVTLEPVTPETAFEAVKALLNRLDAFLYVLLEV